jgi:Variant SH3 domain
MSGHSLVKSQTGQTSQTSHFTDARDPRCNLAPSLHGATMWGDGASPAAGSDVAGELEGDAAFARRLAKFDAADARFRALSTALADYRAAVGAAAAAGVALAEAAAVFFSGAEGASGDVGSAVQRLVAQTTVADALDPPNVSVEQMSLQQQDSSRTSAQSSHPVGGEHASYLTLSFPGSGVLNSQQQQQVQDVIPAAFRASQLVILEKWTSDIAPRFHSDVCRPIDQCLAQFPEVRSYIKQRNAAAQELARRQKKLRDSGSRVKDKQRKWRECSDRFKMLDDQVVQRFSYIDRTQSHLVLPPLRNLATLLHEYARDAATAMRDISRLVATSTPQSIARNVSPPTHRREGRGPSLSSAHGPEDEGWDDAFDFNDETGAAPADASPDVDGDSSVQLPLGSRGVSSQESSAISVPNVPADGASRQSRGASGSSATNNLTPANLQAAIAPSGAAELQPTVDRAASKETWDQDSRSERQNVLMRLGATFDFTPKEANELPLHAGDVVEVYEKHVSGWWLGRTNHITGYFPRDYTRELSEQEELDFLAERARRRRDKRRGHRRKESQSSHRSGGTTSQSSLAAAAAAALAGAGYPVPPE